MNAKLLAFGIILCFLVSPAIAVDLDYNIIVSGVDVSLVKGHMNYQGVTNDTVSKHEQYIYSVDQATFDYDSTAFFGDYHDISISTNLSGTKSAKSGIGGTDYIENVGLGDNKSCCVFGIRGSARNLTVVSIIATQPTTLDYGYVIEAQNGEAGVGYIKQTENTTTTSRYGIRGANVIVAGQQTCIGYPASPAEKSIKEDICVWGKGGQGFPIFYSRHGPVNET
jgi:hypothetical protein